MNDSNTPTTSTETKVFNLTVELDDLKRRKKQFVKAYNAEIKRLNEEIDDLLNPEDAVIELP